MKKKFKMILKLIKMKFKLKKMNRKLKLKKNKIKKNIQILFKIKQFKLIKSKNKKIKNIKES